jgi:hypothetical protein
MDTKQIVFLAFMGLGVLVLLHEFVKALDINMSRKFLDPEEALKYTPSIVEAHGIFMNRVARYKRSGDGNQIPTLTDYHINYVREQTYINNAWVSKKKN